jgi:hypothetical protein
MPNMEANVRCHVTVFVLNYGRNTTQENNALISELKFILM